MAHVKHTLGRDLVVATKSASLDDAVEKLALKARSAGSGVGFESWVKRAFSLGVSSVIERDLGSVDGRLVWQAGKHVVQLNSRKPRTRKLFSLSHELSHLLLEQAVPYLGTSLKQRSLFYADYDVEEERLADRMAGEMLLLRDEVRAACDAYSRTLVAAIALSRHFGVSIAAAIVRINEVCRARHRLFQFEIDASAGRLKFLGGAVHDVTFRAHINRSWEIPISERQIDSLIRGRCELVRVLAYAPGCDERELVGEMRLVSHDRVVVLI